MIKQALPAVTGIAAEWLGVDVTFRELSPAIEKQKIKKPKKKNQKKKKKKKKKFGGKKKKKKKKKKVEN